MSGGGRCRLRDLGIVIGRLPTGPLNAITDVEDVRVGHATVIADEPAVARTGVTVVLPTAAEPYAEQVFAGFFNSTAMARWAGCIVSRTPACSPGRSA